MAFCQVCGKTKQYGHNVSHSKRRTKRVFMPNVFGKRMLLSPAAGSRFKARGSRDSTDVESIKRVKICAKCLKRAKKFGFVKARETAVLGGMLVQVVDWAELARKKIEVEKVKEKAQEVKEENKKKKAEVSVEELVGKKVA